MKYSNKKQSKSRSRTPMLVLLALVLLAGGVFAYFQLTGNDDSVANDEPESIVADPEFSDGTDREPATTPARDGTIREDDGSDDESSDNTAEPITSDSGNISVTSPQPNDQLSSGDRLTGNASVSQVQYRLIDNNMGVIASGSLSVTDGQFSGRFEFNSQGSEGRLDIFSYDEDGIERDQVEIDVRLN